MKRYVSVIILILLTRQFCYSQNNQQKVIKLLPIDSLTSLTLKSLETKKIVMLGDGTHGHGYFKSIVINTLYFWINSLEKNPKNQTIPHRLFLCLEADSIKQALLNEVIDNGNFSNYLTEQLEEATKFGGWDKYSIDNLEFLFELRTIKKRIAELNKNTTQDISLVIKGVERPTSFSNFSTMYQMGEEKYRKELFLWFAKERDKLVAENIHRILKQNKDYKAIVFYGTAHLKRNYIDKSPWAFSAKQEPVYGYFLAHYLDEYFGRDQVEIYYTAKVHGEGTDVIQKFEKDDEYEDFYIQCNVLPDFPFPLYIMNNKAILNSLINLSNEYIEGVKEEDYLLFVQFSRMFIDHVKRSYLYTEKNYKGKIDSLATYLMQCSRKDFKYSYKTIRRISKELINTFDLVKNIEEMDKWIMMIDGFDDKWLYKGMLKTIIYNLPIEIPEETFYSNLSTSYRSDFLSRFENDQIKNRINELRTYYAISSMWINTKEENDNVLKYLQQATGSNYTTTKDWSEWWRKKYIRTQ